MRQALAVVFFLALVRFCFPGLGSLDTIRLTGVLPVFSAFFLLPLVSSLVHLQPASFIRCNITAQYFGLISIP